MAAGTAFVVASQRCWHPANISELGFALQLNNLAMRRSAILSVRVSALSLSVSLPLSGFSAGITAGGKMTRTREFGACGYGISIRARWPTDSFPKRPARVQMPAHCP
jgi:hypothetical protein